MLYSSQTSVFNRHKCCKVSLKSGSFMLAKMKILMLFIFILISSLACNDNRTAKSNTEKIQLNKKLHFTVSELDETMYYLRGDILQSQIDSNYEKLAYLNKLEDHSHNLTKQLNKIKYVSIYLWNDFKAEVNQELAKANETLKHSSYFE